MAKKNYVLGMFPYPSGDGLHVGHVRIYTAVDVMSRYFRMKNRPSSAKASDGLAGEPMVLSPIGWDAFGLPAENAAIKKKTIPQKIVPQNYNNFRQQMKNLNFDFDWEREFATTDPTYYGLTQWIFLELYKKGLVYREQVPINWCPKCKTGLANEEVLPDGTHERCGTATGKKLLPQWVMKITDYADRLLNDLDEDLGVTEPRLDKNRSALDWPRGILEMQRNWIGKKEGINMDYPVVGTEEVITCFTTAPVNWGMTFIVLSPSHPLVEKMLDGKVKLPAKNLKNVVRYVENAKGKSDQQLMVEAKDKSGVFTGLYATNRIAGWDVPVWIADFVVAEVGTGAVQGCPAHDYRDFEFAKKYGIEIKRVVVGPDGDVSEVERQEQIIVKGMPGKMVNSEHINGLDFTEGLKKTMDIAEEKGWGKRTTTYHLRDWVFSRQRYWGEPIPLVYCNKCGDEHGVVPLSEKDLPLTLPELDNYEPTDTGESPLSRIKDWVETKCPKCGGPARRETDTMPNWAGSCWYHLAFAFWDKDKTASILETYKKKSEMPFSEFWKNHAKPEINKWLPVDWYLGGAEHAVLHLLYARFWSKVLQDLGHLDFSEPYLRLRSVGIVLAEDGRKMSKSWGNVINPDDVVKEFGSDAVRLYEMFMGPWNQSIAWDSRALVGMKRLTERIEKVVEEKGKVGKESSPLLADKLSKLVKQVEKGILEQKFNTSIAGIMEFLNLWKNSNLVISQKHARNFAQILSPFAPTTAQNIYEKVGGKGEVTASEWPRVSADEVEVPVTIAVQVNGKLRGTLSVPKSISMNEKEMVKMALEYEKIQKWMTEEPKKKIFVPGRLINLVV